MNQKNTQSIPHAISMPVYNSEKCITDALDSLLAQTVKVMDWHFLTSKKFGKS